MLVHKCRVGSRDYGNNKREAGIFEAIFETPVTMNDDSYNHGKGCHYLCKIIKGLE
jgi:hypothetical protein